MTPTTAADAVLRRSVVTTEIETPEPRPDRATVPSRAQQPGPAMHTKKPQQPRRKSDLKFFVLFVGITAPAHQRRRATAHDAEQPERAMGPSRGVAPDATPVHHGLNEQTRAAPSGAAGGYTAGSNEPAPDKMPVRAPLVEQPESGAAVTNGRL